MKKVGKSWGILSRDIEHTRCCRELGCQLFSVLGDVDCLRVGLETLEKRYTEIQISKIDFPVAFCEHRELR